MSRFGRAVALPGVTARSTGRFVAAVCALVLFGCSTSVSVFGEAGSDGSVPDNGSDGATDTAFDIAPDGPMCGAVACPAGQTCCAATQQCVDPACTDCCTTAIDGGAGDTIAIEVGGPCSSPSECPAGTTCCPSTHACYDSRCLACCPVAIDAGPPPCTVNSDCVTSDYCEGSGCGTAGSCVARPLGCPTVYAPVCGCDGMTYDNSCVAARSGVRVYASGPCGTTALDASADVVVPPCHSDLDCSGGEHCCAGTGVCYNVACLACCMTVFVPDASAAQ